MCAHVLHTSTNGVIGACSSRPPHACHVPPPPRPPPTNPQIPLSRSYTAHPHPTLGPLQLTPAEKEAEFWRIVEAGEDDVIEVLYGADLDTTEVGSGFPRAPPLGNRWSGCGACREGRWVPLASCMSTLNVPQAAAPLCLRPLIHPHVRLRACGVIPLQ